MATNAYAHNTGNQIGIIPNKLCLTKVSTPVMIKNDSEIVSAIKPNARNMKSFFSLCTTKDIAMIIISIKANMMSFLMNGISTIIHMTGTAC